ncbi:hypothetical protein [Microbacterium indicum]|uniref:hypothetical protein n=1 Tax=Microbacterium indicum TaxID=358100 RepID=UPI0003FEA19F|nr:hypothetical protein [Microbacterium indicum]
MTETGAGIPTEADDAPDDARGYEALTLEPTEEHKQQVAAQTGAIAVIASDTFGWIHPEAAHQELTRRERATRVSRLTLIAVGLASLGLLASWVTPWGGIAGLLGAALAAATIFRSHENRAWCAAAIGTGLLSVACSAYWLVWILPQLA